MTGQPGRSGGARPGAGRPRTTPRLDDVDMTLLEQIADLHNEFNARLGIDERWTADDALYSALARTLAEMKRDIQLADDLQRPLIETPSA